MKLTANMLKAANSLFSTDSNTIDQLDGLMKKRGEHFADWKQACENSKDEDAKKEPGKALLQAAQIKFGKQWPAKPIENGDGTAYAPTNDVIALASGKTSDKLKKYNINSEPDAVVVKACRTIKAFNAYLSDQRKAENPDTGKGKGKTAGGAGKEEATDTPTAEKIDLKRALTFILNHVNTTVKDDLQKQTSLGLFEDFVETAYGEAVLQTAKKSLAATTTTTEK